MPFVQITWLPKACRTAAVREEVARAVIKAMTSVTAAEVSPDNLVVRFGESVDAFPLPMGYSRNAKLRAHPSSAPDAVGRGSDDPFSPPKPE